MASKTLVALGVLLAALLLVSTDVAARELAEQHEEKVDGVDVADQGRGGCNDPNVVDGENGNDHQGDNKHCRHGCCKYRHHRCVRCCRTADEILDVEYMHVTSIDNLRTDEEEVDGVSVADQGRGGYNVPSVVDGENGNGHHGGNRRCRHRCCKYRYGRCVRCCRTADEIPDAEYMHVTSTDNLRTDEEEVDSVGVADQGRGGYNGPSVIDGENGNGHHGSNRRCRHGCCKYRHHRCVRCCRTADEILDAEYMHVTSIDNLRTDEEEVDGVGVADQGRGGYNVPSVVDGENGNGHHGGNRRCRHGCCKYRHHRCVKCCRTADEIPDAEYMHATSIDNLRTDDEEVDGVSVADQGRGGYNGPSVIDGENGNGHHGGNRRCRHGCCKFRYGRCVKCCRTASEIPDAEYMHVMSM